MAATETRTLDEVVWTRATADDPRPEPTMQEIRRELERLDAILTCPIDPSYFSARGITTWEQFRFHHEYLVFQRHLIKRALELDAERHKRGTRRQGPSALPALSLTF
jgi:hypothetical protein